MLQLCLGVWSMASCSGLDLELFGRIHFPSLENSGPVFIGDQKVAQLHVPVNTLPWLAPCKQYVQGLMVLLGQCQETEILFIATGS